MTLRPALRILLKSAALLALLFGILYFGGAKAIMRWDADRHFGHLTPLAESFVEALATGDTESLEAYLDGSPDLERTIDFSRYQPRYFKDVLTSMRLRDGLVADDGLWLFFDIEAHGACPYPDQDPRVLQFFLTQDDGRWRLLSVGGGPC